VNPGARDSFARSKSDEVLKEAIRDVLGVDWRIESIVDPTAGPTGAGRRPPSAPDPVPQASPAASGGGGWDDAPPPAAPPTTPPPAAPSEPQAPPRSSAAREAMRQSAKQSDAEPAPPRDLDADVDPDTDMAVADSPQNQTDLLARELGAQIIEERPNS
jgi:DNA polymerase-3 subunit gamma/tau